MTPGPWIDPDGEERRSALVWVVLTMAIGAFLIYCLTGNTSELRLGEKIARYMVERGAPAARVVTDRPYRTEIVRSAVAAGQRHDLPPSLLLSMAFFESSYRSTAIGTRGELGLLQVGEQARRVCLCPDIQTDIQTQIDCGACWLARARRACGNLRGALTMYAVGKCTSGDPRVARLVSARLTMARTLEGE